MSKNNSEESHTLSSSKIVFFNLPNLGIQTLYALNTYLIIIFYVNIMGQPPIYIGIIQSIVILISALLCPVFGALCDKFHSRFGRKKTFMLIFLPFIVSSFILIWTPPIPETSYGVLYIPTILWCFIFSAIFNLSTSAFVTSYVSMIPELSTQESNRVKISELNMIFLVIGAGFGSLISVILFGTATENLSREKPDLFIRDTTIGSQIYSQVIIYAIMCSILFILYCFLMMRKINELEMEVAKKISITELFKKLVNPLKNSNFKKYLISLELMYISIMMFQTLIINFVTFVIEIRAEEFIILGVIIFIAAITAFVFFDYLSKRLGLKKVMIISLILAVAAFTSSLILLIPMTHEELLITGVMIIAFCLAAFVATMIFPMAIASSLIDAAKAKSSENVSGSYMGLLTMCSTLAGAASALTIGIFLQLFGTTTKISYVFIFLFGGVLMAFSALMFSKVKIGASIGQTDHS